MATTTGPDHGGPIFIGLRDLYEQLQLLDRNMSQLNAKVDTSMQLAQMSSQSLATQLSDIRHNLSDHEVRLRALETRAVVTPKNMWAAVAVLTGIAGIVVTIILSAMG